MHRFLTELALLLALPLTAQDRTLGQRRRELPARTSPRRVKGHDRPDLRRLWNFTWFGGRLSPAYLDFKNLLAAQEMSKWGRLIARPQADSAFSTLPAAAAPTGTGGTWVNLGPTANSVTTTYPDIDSGRPVAVLADPTTPTTLYLATSGGGVFKCTNASLTSTGDWTWTPITDGLPASGSSGNVSLGAMAMDPTSSQVLYLGLGDAFDAEGRGFFKSTDGGTTWTAATGIGNATISYDILPLSSTQVFWGTNDGLKVSSNGGASFSSASGGPATGMVWTVRNLSSSDLVCSMEDASSVGHIYYSNNAGATWQTATLPTNISFPIGRITLATSASSTAVVWGICEDTTNLATTGDTTVAPGFLKSTDKGATWTWIAPNPAPFTSFLSDPSNKGDGGDGGQGWYNHMLTVAPGNSNYLFLGANLAAWRSLNGGASASQLTHWYGYNYVYSHADFHAASWSGDGATLYVANDGGLAIFRDPFRATIPSSPGGYPASDVTFLDNRRNKGLASHLVYNVGSTTATSPADAKWRISLGMQDDGTRIRQPNPPATALTGTEGTFDDEIGGDGFATLIHPTDGTQMLGSLYYTDIYKSTNGGATFSESITGITEANSANAANLAPFQPRLAPGDAAHPSTVYTATNGKVYQSTDFGTTWSALSTSGLPAAGTNSASDPATALYIRNLGAATNDPNALGIAANQGRVYLSYNGGSSWTQAGTLPNNGSYTSSIWFDRVSSQTVYVASVAPVATNSHLWKTTNGGVSWTAIDTGTGFPFGIPVHVVVTDPANASKVYVGTDFGVYFSTNGGTTWSRFGSNLPLVATRDLYVAPDGSLLRAATFGRGVWELQAASSGAPGVTLLPSSVTMVTGGTQSFTPTVTNGTANTVTWSATSGTIAAGPTASGTPQTYTAPATGTADTVKVSTVDTPVATAQAAVTLVAPSSVTVTVNPAVAEVLTVTGTQTFSAAVSPITSQAVTWSGPGMNSSTGLFSAGSLGAGSYTVTATSPAAGQSGTATVKLLAPSSVTVTVSPATGTLGIGSARTFTATVAGPALAANQSVTWTASGGGTITSGGLFTATTAGSFTITATNTFSGATGSATVNVITLDLNGDGVVSPLDLLTFAKYYGTATASCLFSGDSTVSDTDLAILLAGM